MYVFIDLFLCSLVIIFNEMHGEKEGIMIQIDKKLKDLIYNN